MDNKTYDVGDTGPAGGIIFYNKGDNSDGWQYLEAAPAEAEFQRIEWGPGNLPKVKRTVTLEGNTKMTIGSGKQNTRILYEKLQELFSATEKEYALDGEQFKWQNNLKNHYKYAIRVCAEFEFAGFKDWFLPSREELDLIYKNLRSKGIGGFGRNKYWTSSEGTDTEFWKPHRWVYYQDFDKGTIGVSSWSNSWYIRAIRSF
jgi:hypothetical protein